MATASTQAARARVATVWLGGCSGCHMSYLDMDERLIDLAAVMDLVFSPLLDIKEFPADVDVTLVEGAVANVDNEELLHKVRANSKLVVALGDCAVSGNVTAMRNTLGSPDVVLKACYLDSDAIQPQIPSEPGIVPKLLHVRPIHQVVEVDYHIPGCPPSADLIHFAVSELLAGRKPDLKGKYHFG